MFSKENNAIGIVSSVICLIIAFLAEVLSDDFEWWKYWLIAFVIILVGSLVLMLINYLILSNKNLVFKLKESEIDNLICTNIEFIHEIENNNFLSINKKYYALRLVENIESLLVLFLKNDGTTKTKS